MIRTRHHNHVILEGHHLLNVPCETQEDLSRFILCMPGKTRVILVVRSTEKNRPLFESVGSIASMRHDKRVYRKWLNEGVIGITSQRDGSVNLILSSHRMKEEILDVVL